MEFTDQYVYVNVTDAIATANPNSLKVVLNYNNDRAPYALVEVMSFSIKTDVATKNHYTLKVEEIAQNYVGYDNEGTALAVAPFNSDIAAGHHVYTMYGSPAKVMFSNARALTFYIVDDEEVRQQVGPAFDVENYTMMLKVSYPNVGVIPPTYRAQIPL
jgi:hypothetical protein